MDFTVLKYFQAVARNGNMTKTARELYITQPNLSKRIAQLEEEIGVPLFEHRKGKIVLNDYGRMFLSSVDIAFAELKAGMENVQRTYTLNQNILSLGSNILHYLAIRLPRFSEAHPEIRIRQLDFTTLELVQNLLDRNINYALSNEMIEDERIDFQLIDSNPYVFVMHKNHPLAECGKLSMGQLKEATFICDTFRFQLSQLYQACRVYDFVPKVGYEVQSNELMYNLLNDNRGVAIIPIVMACEMLNLHPDSDIRICTITDDIAPAIIGIGRLKNQVDTQAGQYFIEFIKEGLVREKEVIKKFGYGYLIGEADENI